jgi:acetyl-CoA acetyltransferase
MSVVSILRAHSLSPDSFWGASLGDLALEAATPLLSGAKIDALFCAAPAAAFAQRQADFAALVADRLGITPDIALSVDAADASGAVALEMAWRTLNTGGAKAALVVGAAKVSDFSEAERIALMDRALDQNAEVSAGLTFASQAGLLATQYCRTFEKDVGVFAETTAANLAAWARHAGRPAVTAAELRRDLSVAPPLVRSDFPQLLDGAAAVLLVAGKADSPWSITNVGSATDTIALWERKEPLALAAVERAVHSIGDIPGWLEIDAAASVVQVLIEEAVKRVAKSKSSRINVRGSAVGRGCVLGASALYQVQDIVEADAAQPGALMISTAGLGSRAVAVKFARGSA